MVGANPRKGLPIMTPTSEDHKRWWDINRRLSPKDKEWKDAWEEHSRLMFHRFQNTPDVSTSTSWIEQDLAFAINLSKIIH